MTFLNAILLFGTLALVVPLIIHLLNRSRYRVVRWGAMHLLKQVVQVNRRQVQIEQWLLLIVRCAIPVVLALCLARPVITGWKALLGGEPASLAVLLDNSYSMQAGTSVRSSFQGAVEELGRILGQARPDSEASVILFGGSVEGVMERPTTDLRRLTDALQDLKADGGAVRSTSGVDVAGTALGKMTHTRRELIIASDFQRGDWAMSASEVERLAQQIKGVPGKPMLTLLALRSEARNNICVDPPQIPRGALGVGQVLTIRASVHNYGSEPFRDLRVYCRIDGRQHAASQVPLLGAGGSATVEFTCQFNQAGSHLAEVEADAPGLKVDKIGMAAVQVLDRLPVLLIEGDKEGASGLGESSFLRMALQPFRESGGVGSDLIEVETAGSADFREEHLSGKRAVVLANVPQLEEDQVRALEAYVRGGGGLLIFSGDRVDVEWYNRQLYGDGAGLLPMRIAGLGGSLEDEKAGATIAEQRFAAPALQRFNDKQNGDLGRAAIHMWHKVDAAAATGQAHGAVILARLSTGDAFLVQREYGEGLVMHATTACSERWSNLPMRPFYVRLMQDLVTGVMANTMPNRNVAIGHPLTAYLGAQAIGQTMKMTGPDGRQYPTTAARGPGGGAVMEFGQTGRPGLYVLAGSSPIHFVVNADRGESRLEFLNEQELRQLAGQLSADLVHSGDEYAQLEQSRRFGQEWWKPLLLATMGLMVGEQVMTRRFARRKGPGL